jgi:ribosomal protein S18 acetylase RimI-like enzyme
MKIRPARQTDAGGIARVYVQTWQSVYRGILPDGYLDAMTVPGSEKSFSQDLQNSQVISFVAEKKAKEIVGFVTGGDESQRDEIYSGEIYTLYVQKDCRRQGVGLKLVSALANRLNRLGVYAMQVRVLKQNPNRRFYENINGIALCNQRLLFAGAILDAIVYGWISTDLILNPFQMTPKAKPNRLS